MENEVTCPLCGSELILLPKDHPEYFRVGQIRDGNYKWFLCTNSECVSVFVKDKQTGSWNYSPDTYTKLTKENKIKDYLT